MGSSSTGEIRHYRQLTIKNYWFNLVFVKLQIRLKFFKAMIWMVLKVFTRDFLFVMGQIVLSQCMES